MSKSEKQMRDNWNRVWNDIRHAKNQGDNISTSFAYALSQIIDVEGEYVNQAASDKKATLDKVLKKMQNFNDAVTALIGAGEAYRTMSQPERKTILRMKDDSENDDIPDTDYGPNHNVSRLPGPKIILGSIPATKEQIDKLRDKSAVFAQLMKTQHTSDLVDDLDESDLNKLIPTIESMIFVETGVQTFIWNHPSYGGDNTLYEVGVSMEEYTMRTFGKTLRLFWDGRGLHIIKNFCSLPFKEVLLKQKR